MIIDNKAMVELFGTDSNKESYYKNKRVSGSMKTSLILRAKKEYTTVEDLGKGKYKLENKIISNIIPNDKMIHPIYGNLIPAILINVKEYHDSSKVFCLSLNSIYSNFNMINNNYIHANSRKGTVSKILDVMPDVCYEFFDTTHAQLKYYLKNSLNLLSALGLIKYNMIPYVSLAKKEVDTSIIKGTDDIITITRRRATKEEEQFIADIDKDIRIKYDIGKGKKLFGEPLREYKDKISQINIEYIYECYEIICLEKVEIENILCFYNSTNKETLSENFTNNFISLVMSNAESKHLKAIENNMIDFYRFNRKYLDDFLTLSNTTLDYKSETVVIPKYKVDYIEDSYGGIRIKTTETN